MKKTLFLILITILLLTSCNTFPGTPTVSSDELATQVSQILTTMPSPSPTNIIIPTNTIAASTATVDVIAVTPTQEQVIETQSSTLEPSQTPEATNLTATPTATIAISSTPENTPQPTPTVPSSDPKLKLGSPTWVDNFKTGNNWPLDKDNYTSVEVKDSKLVFSALADLDGWRLSWPVIKNFYLEMSAETGMCEGSDHYGLMFRVPDKQKADQGYLFGLTCDGRYSLRKWDNQIMTSLIPWTTSTAITKGSNQINRLGVLANGSQLALYANGVLLKEINDNSFTAEGGFGIFIGSDQTPDFTIKISEVAYWETK